MQGIPVQVKFPHEMIQGLEGQFPPITGYVLTNAKSNPLVEVALTSPLPTDKGDNPILASWTYGLGKAVAFTSDAGKRWATAWTGWENYDKFFSQVVRWTMRPVGDTGKFSVATDVQDGNIRVVVSALDKDDEFINFLNIGGSVVGPDLKPLDIEMKQVAPGRYVGELPAASKGELFRPAKSRAGPGAAAGRREHSLLGRVPRARHQRGPVARTCRPSPQERLAGQDHRRHAAAASDPPSAAQQTPGNRHVRHDLAKATSSQDIWHLLVFAAACVFLADVFVRRVTINFAWVPPLAAKVRDRLLRRPAMAEVTVVMDRLRSRKAEVTEQLEQRRAATRFEPSPDQPAGEAVKDLGEATAVVAEAAAAIAGPASRARARELHQPPAEGQTKSLGRPRQRQTGRRLGKMKLNKSNIYEECRKSGKEAAGRMKTNRTNVEIVRQLERSQSPCTIANRRHQREDRFLLP